MLKMSKVHKTQTVERERFTVLNDITDMQGMLSETIVAESYIQGFRDCAELIVDVMFGSSENLK